MQKGDKYNSLTAVRRIKPQQAAVWEFKCDCGKKHEASVPNVKYGSIKSCGCAKKTRRDNKLQQELFRFDMTIDDVCRATGENRKTVTSWCRSYGPFVRQCHIDKIKDFLSANADKT